MSKDTSHPPHPTLSKEKDKELLEKISQAEQSLEILEKAGLNSIVVDSLRAQLLHSCWNPPTLWYIN